MEGKSIIPMSQMCTVLISIALEKWFIILRYHNYEKCDSIRLCVMIDRSKFD